MSPWIPSPWGRQVARARFGREHEAELEGNLALGWSVKAEGPEVWGKRGFWVPSECWDRAEAEASEDWPGLGHCLPRPPFCLKGARGGVSRLHPLPVCVSTVWALSLPVSAEGPWNVVGPMVAQ